MYHHVSHNYWYSRGRVSVTTSSIKVTSGPGPALVEAVTEISDIVVCGNSDGMVNVVVSGSSVSLVTGALPLTL